MLVFVNQSAAAADWSPTKRPIQKVVFEKAESPGGSSDGWKSKYREGQQRNRNTISMHFHTQGPSKKRVRDPFGDQRLAKSESEAPNTTTPATAAGQVVNKGEPAVRPVGQIRDSTFGFVDQKSSTEDAATQKSEHPRIRLSFPQQPQHNAPIAINATVSKHNPELSTSEIYEADSSSKSLAFAKYDQSVLAVTEEPEAKSKPEKFREAQGKSLAPQTVPNQSKEAINQQTTESISGDSIQNPLSKKEALPKNVVPLTSALISTPDTATKSELSILASSADPKKLDAEEKTKNKTANTGPPLDKKLSDTPEEDLTRPAPPPFESLDLYSDDSILESDSKALEAEIDAAIAAEANAYERDCRASREYLLDRTLADISLNIAVSGVPGADFPVSCDIETRKIPLNSYRFSQQEPLTFAWTASGLCHKPLYFREIQAERYGHSIGRISQPFLSASHFFCNVAILPYNMGMRPPQECVYALGHYWPGNTAPRYIPAVPISIRGGLMQAGAVLGAAYVLP